MLLKTLSPHLREKRQSGSSIIEVLVALFLFSLVGLGMTRSAILSMNFQKRAEIGNIAKNLAVSKAELLSGIALDQLNDTYDGTETNLTVPGHKVKFTRITNVTVNSDGSRTLDITVSSTSPYLPKAISYSTRFAPWEA